MHDYLREYGGAERVLESLNEIWKDAPIYTASFEHQVMEAVGFKVPSGVIHPLLTQLLPWRYPLRKHYFFLYPFAFRRLKLDADVILSNCSYAAKFVEKSKNSLHICYLQTVPRFLWGYETETKDLEVYQFDKYLKPVYRKIVPMLKTILKKMDYQAAQKVDYFIANSKNTAGKIKEHYKRDALVIYPPVDTEKFKPENSVIVNKNKDYFLVISRLGEYKKVDIVVEAFNQLKLPLKIVGEGSQLPYLRSIAKDNIEILGWVSDEEKTRLLQRCQAFIFPTDEDFGIAPVEAMAAGKPVIAYQKGGAIETIVEGVTGAFFEEQTPSAIIDVVKKFDPDSFNPDLCQKQAEKFSKDEFKSRIKFFVEEAWEKKTNT